LWLLQQEARTHWCHVVARVAAADVAVDDVAVDDTVGGVVGRFLE